MELTNNRNENSVTQQSLAVSPSTPKTLSNFPTFHDFSVRFSPDNWEGSFRQPTKCLTCAAPTLTDINLAYGNGRSIAWLMAHLQVFQERLNVPNKMSAFEIETCAQTIHDHYHHLKTTELMLFFARLLGGMYPVDWHGYVTTTKVVSALREHFMPWRNNLLYQIERNEREKHERESKTNTMSWEEYCRLEGKKGDDHPLKRILGK